MNTLYTLSCLPLLLAMSSWGARPALADFPETSPFPPGQQLYININDLAAQDLSFEPGLRFEPDDLQILTRSVLLTGMDKTLVADGSEHRLDLAGRDGRDASHPQVYGRVGEAGGDGGTLTVYYTDIADLKQIYVDASGGQGGSGVPRLPRYQCSEREVDSLSPDSIGPPEIHTPNRPDLDSLESPVIDHSDVLEALPEIDLPEPPGAPLPPTKHLDKASLTSLNGVASKEQNNLPIPVPDCQWTTSEPGPSGEEGRRGQLRIINRSTVLPSEQAVVSLSVPSDLVDRTFQLSKDIWRERSGAAALLAPGSIIADEYLEFVDRIERTVRVRWLVPTESLPSLNNITLVLADDGQINLNAGADVWIANTLQAQDDVLEIAIRNIVPASEVTDLAVGRLVGDDDALNLQVIDLAGHSEALETSFQLRYRAAASTTDTIRPQWETHYEGEVPAELVTRDHNRFSLNLGALPIDSQYLQPGTLIDVEIEVTRSLGERSATQTLTWQGEIR